MSEEFNFNDDDNIDENTSDTNTDSSNKEKKPINLSRTGTYAVLLLFCCFIIAVFVVMLKGCGIGAGSEARSKSQKKPSETVTIQAVRDTETESEKLEDSSDFLESSSLSSNDIKESILPETQYETEKHIIEEEESSQTVQSDTISETVKQNIETEGIDNQGSLVEVGDPMLNPEVEASGMVSKKSVYEFEGSYLYEISILVVIEDGYADMKYFCPKNTYDALEVGDSLNVTYQISSKGTYSVATISK